MNMLNSFRPFNNLDLYDFLDAFSVSLSETYKFEVTVANISDKKPSDELPEGKVGVTVADNVWRHFEKFVRLSDLNKILVFKDHYRTDLDSIFELWDTRDHFPLLDVLKRAKSEAGLREDKYFYNLKRLFESKYQPDKLQGVPIQLSVQVLDEKLITESSELIKLARPRSADEKIEREIADNLLNQQGFENSLILIFELSVTLKSSQQLKKMTHIWLDSFSVKWPLSTSVRQVELLYWDEKTGWDHSEEKSLLFNPEDQHVVWTNLPLIKEASEDEDAEEITYKSWQMCLIIKEPGEFYDVDLIEGSFKVTVPTLLSGTKLEKSKKARALTEYGWLGELLGLEVPGHLDDDDEESLTDVVKDSFARRLFRKPQFRWTPDFSEKSEIKVDFKAHIQELFLDRYFSPYQWVCFSDLILSERRVVDVVNLLNDLHFRCYRYKVVQSERETDAANGEKVSYRQANGRLSSSTPSNEKIASESEKKIQNHLIYAEREEGAGKLRLWLLLEGQSAKTTREKTITGDHTFKTDYFSGTTTIYIRGQLRGDSDRVVQVISEIHAKLKERFHHVSTIK